MKHFMLFNEGRSLLSRLVLFLTLILGGATSALADTTLFGGSVASGWTCSYSFSGSTLSNWSTTTYRYYTSNDVITINSGEKIVISAKKYGTQSGQRINVNYSSDDGSSWNTAAYFEPSDKDNYSNFEVTNLSETAYKIQFEFRYVYINSIILKSAATLPVLSIIKPDGGDAFGYVTINTTKTYTVKNTGAGSMDVEITSSDAAFTLSTSSLTGITNDGSGKTFDVTFNYDAAEPQPHSSTITITPTFDGAEAQSFIVSAGPEVVLNENEETTWTAGNGKSVYVKYTAKDGWNTICMPFVLYNPSSSIDYVTPIFGEGWKAYSYSSYEGGVLTFAKTNILGGNMPYLIYVESAATHTNGVLFGDVYVNRTSAPRKPESGDDVTFQGTYAPITAGNFTTDMYGVTTAGEVRPGNGTTASMKGYRAYFTGISAPTSGPGVKMVILEDDGGETDLGFVKMVDENAKDVYTLTGQKVQKGRKGIYIVNGKKVVIK